MCPKSYYLFNYTNGQWWAFPPVRRYPTHIGYSRHPSPTSTPTGTVPATPILFQYKIHIPLPVTPIVHVQHQPSTPVPLATRLLTPPDDWAQPLWTEIHPHAHTDTLRNALLTTTRIILVSDAAVHPNGTGTCAWTIWANAEVWSGEGYVPGLVNDMYSGLAEAYGIYTVISFFYHYLQLHPLILPAQCTIHVYCDNSGVIQKLQRKPSQLYPRDTIQDDYPIYAEIIHQTRGTPTSPFLFIM